MRHLQQIMVKMVKGEAAIRILVWHTQAKDSKQADELAGLAIKSPGKYLNTLQALSRLINGADTSLEAMIQLRKGLLIAMPKSAVQPHSETRFLNEIDRILLNELELND